MLDPKTKGLFKGQIFGQISCPKHFISKTKTNGFDFLKKQIKPKTKGFFQ